MRSWIIGGDTSCDLVVDAPVVSAMHCRLSQTDAEFRLEDLGSTNGTYVEGIRISEPMNVAPWDRITLGRTQPLPWPPEAVQFATIGRNADNEIVLEDPRVSGRHARLVRILPDGETWIEDLGSSNGTALNAADRKIERPARLSTDDIVYFGSFAVSAARLLAMTASPVPDPAPAVGLDNSTSAVAARTSPYAALGTTPAEIVDRRTWLLTRQAPILAILVALSTRDVAASLFALTMLAVWFGGSLAVSESLDVRGRAIRDWVARRWSISETAPRLSILLVLAAVQCTIALAIVHGTAGLRGSFPAMLGVLTLASWIALCLGLTVFGLVRNPATAGASMAVGLAVMVGLGGMLWKPVSQGPVVRSVSAATPTRWTFEALLDFEADAQSAIVPPGPAETSIDLAEPYFPAARDRMGPLAATLALVAILAGLVALDAFTSWDSERRRAQATST